VAYQLNINQSAGTNTSQLMAVMPAGGGSGVFNENGI
jgi:hypothetical protein